MKQKILNAIVALLFVFAVVEAFVLYHWRETIVRQKETIATLENTVSHIGKPQETIKVITRDSDTLNVAKTDALGVTKKNLEQRYPEVMEVAEETKVKAKDINELINIVSVTSDTIRAPTIINPIGSVCAYFTDPYITLNVELTDSLQQAEIDYQVRDSLVFITFQKRHSLLFGLIKWKEAKRVEVYSKNPKSTITNLEMLENIE